MKTDSSQASQSVKLRIDEVVEFVRRVCVANSNAVIYSFTHPVTFSAIKSAHEYVTSILQRMQSPLVTSLTPQKDLLVAELVVETRNPLVAQFVGRLAKLDLTNLLFKPGLTEEEFADFFYILNMKEDDLKVAGGVQALFDKGNITHIVSSRVAYVMVGEDQRVVSRDAKVVEGPSAGGDADEEMVQYMVREMLKSKGDSTWLLDLVKNSPKQAAMLISQGLDYASKNKDSSVTGEDMVQALMSNVRYVAQSLVADSAPGTAEKNPQEAGKKDELKDAVLALEAEMRTRASAVGSTEKSAKFLNDILGVVASYSDEVRAERVSRDFVRGQIGMKKAEELLKSLSGANESTEDILDKMRQHMIKGGMKSEEVELFLKTGAAAKAPRKPRRKTFDQALHDGLAQKVGKLGTGGEEQESVLTDLTTFVENKIEEKEKESKGQVQKLNRVVARRDVAIDRLASGGVVLWDEEGVVEYVSKAAGKLTGVMKGTQLRAEFRQRLNSQARGIESPADSPAPGWDELETTMLKMLAFVLADEEGNPVGAVFDQAGDR